MTDTIAAISTGSQVSAIGIVRISGDEAISAVSSLFSPLCGISMKDAEDRRLYFGSLKDSKDRLIDRCMCTVSHGPDSYTGENTAELQCHGSPVVLRQALDSLFALGVRQALPGEFTKRAFLNGKMDLTSAEAVADLIDAQSAEEARNAACQLSGAIQTKADAIYSRLTDISSHYHAVLDYPDEDIEDFRLSSYLNDISESRSTLSMLLSSFERGRLMKSGIPSVIIGRPNAGKSSLLNALLGYDRAIVTSVPGTTRDTIEEKVRLGGNILRLTDTAGIRDAGDEIEKIGVERSLAALSGAKLIIAVFDSSEEFTDEDRDILTRAAKQAEQGAKCIAVISKNDLSDGRKTLDEIVRIHPDVLTVSISALTGSGIDMLEDAVSRLFPASEIPAGEILTNERQAQAIKTALDYLDAAFEAMNSGATPDIVLTETEGAMGAIGELTGKSIREDITNRIFARFCVGK